MPNTRFFSVAGALVPALIVLLLTSSPAWADGEIELKAIAEQEIEETDAAGQLVTRRVPAGKVVPGDVVIYTIEAKNISDQAVERVSINDPIPEHTTYIEGSAEGRESEIVFSVDGGNSYASGDALVVKDETGASRSAQAEDYTHIRWSFTTAIAPGEARAVSFRARLN